MSLPKLGDCDEDTSGTCAAVAGGNGNGDDEMSLHTGGFGFTKPTVFGVKEAALLLLCGKEKESTILRLDGLGVDLCVTAAAELPWPRPWLRAAVITELLELDSARCASRSFPANVNPPGSNLYLAGLLNFSTSFLRVSVVIPAQAVYLDPGAGCVKLFSLRGCASCCKPSLFIHGRWSSCAPSKVTRMAYAPEPIAGM